MVGPGGDPPGTTPPPTTGTPGGGTPGGGTPGGGTPSVGDTSWTRCARDGELCYEFSGVRDVRFGPDGGPYVTIEAYSQVYCYPPSFGRDDWDPARTRHCDYGPLKTVSMPNPMPGMGGLPNATVAVPRGAAGTGETRVASGSVITATLPRDGDDGAFRIQCGLAKYAFDDPIVYPGQPGQSHLHVFFGNTAVDAYSTAASIASSGNSTCIGGTLNRTSYWAPAVIDVRTGEVQAPLIGTFYYKTGYNMRAALTQPMPQGLRMIAGDKNATGPQEMTGWMCGSRSGASIPADCRPGDVLRLTLIFPQCWDGVNLDSPDHKSHMAYPVYRNPPAHSTCPASHPVALPEITEFFDYPVTARSTTATWRLSSDMYDASQPGGLSAHADWLIGWDPATMRAFVTQCLQRGRDCQVGSLGDGREIN